MQTDSPLASPLPSPMESPFAVPSPDPARCTDANPCAGEVMAPTPEATFQAFLPGVAQPSEGDSAGSQGQATPPDLGTLLNYVAAGVVAVGVLLKLYWYLADRRKRDTQ